MAKNLINSLDDTVSEALSGLSYAYPQLEHHVSHRVVLSPDVRMYIRIRFYPAIVSLH